MKLILILIMFFVGTNLFAIETFITDKSCVKLSEILPVTSDKNLLCNMNYGKKYKISRSKITNLLSREKIHGENLNVTDVIVYRKGIKLTENDIKDKVIKFYKTKYSDTEFKIIKFRMLKEIYVDNKNKFKITLNDYGFGSSYGTIDNGVKKERFYFYLKAFKRVYVSTARIYKGKELQNIELKKIDITKLRQKPVNNPDNYIAKRNIHPDTPITLENAIKKPLNFEGDIVRLIYKSKNIYIETKGILKKNAYLNDKVMIKNIDTGKKVYAKAISADKYLILN